MKPPNTVKIRSLMALGLAGILCLASGPADAQELEYLTRGPVHEAFAGSVSYQPEPGMIIGREIPPLIDELPPEQRPGGDGVAWIPGYWAWDDEQDDFLWISGVWRDIPPGRQWIPGYWDQVDGGQYQWTSGYWAGDLQNGVTYVSAPPPKSLESGPNIPQPSANDFWTPGNWMWSDDRYQWRAGQWRPQRNDWTWVPPHYVWTRRGYVFVDGYWDRPVERRGVLFAPVHFQGKSYLNQSYTPDIVIGLTALIENLFVRPRASHYFFGDYYDPNYRTAGYYPSYVWHTARRGYDPIYSYQRWKHRDDKKWEKEWEKRYQHFQDHSEARPPRTWALMKKPAPGNDRDFDRQFASTYSSYSKAYSKERGFKKLDKKSRDEIMLQSSGVREFRDERQKLERAGSIKNNDSRKSDSANARFKDSPIKGPKAKGQDKKGGPTKDGARPSSDSRTPGDRSKQGKAEKGKAKATPSDQGKGKKPETKKPETKKPAGKPAPQKKSAPAQKGKSESPAKSRKAPAKQEQPKRAAPSKPSKGSGKTESQPKRDPKSDKGKGGGKGKGK